MERNIYARTRAEPAETLARILAAGNIQADDDRIAKLRDALRRAIDVYEGAELGLKALQLRAFAAQCEKTARLLESNPATVFQISEMSRERLLELITSLGGLAAAAEFKAETMTGGNKKRSNTALFEFLFQIYCELSGDCSLSRSAKSSNYQFTKACVDYLGLCPMIEPAALYDRLKSSGDNAHVSAG